MNTSIINDLKYFYSSEALHDFMARCESIDVGKGWPSQNYFAANFKNDELNSMKFYYSFFRPLELHEIQHLLPSTKDIEPYIPYFRPSKVRSLNDTGFSFAIKLSRDLTPTYQVHFRFPYTPLLPKPKNIALSSKDLLLYQGISFEYTNDKVLRKNYYYSKDSSSFLKLIKDFKAVNKGQMLEYTETEDWRKIIHWFLSYDDINEYVNSCNWNQYINFIHFIEKSFKVRAMYPGEYLDQKTRSIYFLNLVGDSPRFEDEVNLNIDTLTGFRKLMEENTHERWQNL